MPFNFSKLRKNARKNTGSKGGCEKHNLIISAIKEHVKDLQGTRLLDLGTDNNGDTVAALKESLKVKEAVGINPAIKKAIKGDGWSILAEDARCLPFREEEFDLIISVAAFEHFQELPIALNEAYRVLRKGGKLISVFGPIWSGCWGHHLWVHHKEKMYTYLNTSLPPWGHLLMSRKVMREWLRNERYDDAVAERMLDFVYESKDQNRIFYDEYESIFLNSDFTVEYFSGITNADKRNGYDLILINDAMDEVRKEYNNHYGFEYDSIKVVLSKD